MISATKKFLSELRFPTHTDALIELGSQMLRGLRLSSTVLHVESTPAPVAYAQAK